MKYCLNCKIQYKPRGRNQKYCGSSKLKFGCAHKVNLLKKIQTNNSLPKDKRGGGSFYRRKYKDILITKFGNKCKLCGSDDDLTIDHIKPQVVDGRDVLENFRILCKRCNIQEYHRLVKKALKYYFVNKGLSDFDCENGWM